MKKLLFVSSAVLTLALGACGTKENPVKPESDVSEPETGEMIGGMNFEVHYAKVKGIVGNELELDLAKDPYADEWNQEVGGDTTEGGEMIAAVETTPALSGDAADELITEDSGSKLELEYTGEKKSIIVPAGLAIFDANTGGELPLNSIKEGSVVMVTMDSDTDEIVNIGVVEK